VEEICGYGMRIRAGAGLARTSIRGYIVTKLRDGYTSSRPREEKLISSIKPLERWTRMQALIPITVSVGKIFKILILLQADRVKFIG
jgi:hypothetical protein